MAETKTIDRLVGERVTPEFVRELLTPGRVKFDFKPTSTNTKSYASKDDGDTNKPVSDFDIDKTINDFVDNVKENEDLVKQLEDIMNDQLKNMKVNPRNSSVADAAKQLGSPDGTIDYDVFKRAEMILDPIVVSVNQTGLNPVLGAYTGNASISGPFLSCNEVTMAIADSWNQTQDAANAASDSAAFHEFAGTATKINESFGKKIAAMIKEIIMGILFNEFWPRIMSILISQLEKLICKPIDTPFILLRFKKLSEENYYKYGLMHRKFSMFKYKMLCSIPFNIMRGAKLEYKPNTEIKVGFVYRTGSKLAQLFASAQALEEMTSGPVTFKVVRIKDVCGLNIGLVDCAPKTTLPGDDGDMAQASEDTNADDALRSMADAIETKFPETDDTESAFTECLEELTKMYDENLEGPGIPTSCLEAARTVLNAVYDEALGQTDSFQMLANFSTRLDSALSGSVAAMEASNAI